MKYICLLCLLITGCSPSAKEASSTPTAQAPERMAILGYMRESMNDPSSYQPGDIRLIGPFMRSDSANIAGMQLIKSDIRAVREKGYALIDGPGKDTVTLLGTRYVHTFRGKNAMGGLVLDSALFVVYKTGKVGSYALH